jgi:hypothetical protein
MGRFIPTESAGWGRVGVPELSGAGERPRVQKADPSYRWLIDGPSGGLFCGGGVVAVGVDAEDTG